MFELDECDHLGRKAFVDTAMQGVSDTINEAYGKAIHNQQAYLRSTEYQVLTKISRSNMLSILLSILDLPTALDIYSSKNTDKTGTWRVLFTTPIPPADLTLLDTIVESIPPTPIS